MIGYTPIICFTYNYGYSAVITESVAFESTTSTVSTESTDVESVAVASAVLLPHEAKEIAANATNMNTNFFISL